MGMGIGGFAMNVRTKVLILLGAALLGVVLALVLRSAMGETGEPSLGSDADFQTFSTFEAMASASDAIVIARADEIVGRELDEGTKDSHEDSPGMPTVFYSLDVKEVLKGSVPETIVLAAPDVERMISDSSSMLAPNDHVLLFLVHQDKEDAPGIETFESFFVTLSLDNGVFDLVTPDLAQPRLPDVFAGDETEATFDPNELPEERRKLPTYGVESIRKQVGQS